jgi:excisionase family DNA binding protein
MDSEYIAILLGLTVQHVRTLTRSGELPAVKVGKNYRYDKGQIMKRLGALEEVNHI